MSLRNIDLSKVKHFECGGRKFLVHDTLSFSRYRELQRLKLEFAYSASFIQIFDNLKLAIDAFNRHKYDEMVVIIHNVMNGITKIESKDDPALRMCALFIDEEGEDVTKYDEAVMQSKIECWASELEVGPFFYLAASLTDGWMPAYEVILKNTSPQENEN